MSYKTLIMVAVMLILSGCAKAAKYYRVNPVFTPVDLNASEPATTNDSYIKRNKDTGEVYVQTTGHLFKDALKNATDKPSKEALAFQLMSISDESCEQHKSLIIANSNTWNIGTGTVTNVLAGLGTVVGGESAKAALSAGAALSNSSRSLVNEELYANALATTILRAIDLKRNDVKKQIYVGLKDDESAKAYSIHKLLYDIDYYHQQCSFMVGMVEVTKALDNRKPTQTEIKEQIAFLESERKKTTEGSAELKALDEEIQNLRLSYKNATK